MENDILKANLVAALWALYGMAMAFPRSDIVLFGEGRSLYHCIADFFAQRGIRGTHIKVWHTDIPFDLEIAEQIKKEQGGVEVIYVLDKTETIPDDQREALKRMLDQPSLQAIEILK